MFGSKCHWTYASLFRCFYTALTSRCAKRTEFKSFMNHLQIIVARLIQSLKKSFFSNNNGFYYVKVYTPMFLVCVQNTWFAKASNEVCFESIHYCHLQNSSTTSAKCLCSNCTSQTWYLVNNFFCCVWVGQVSLKRERERSAQGSVPVVK